MASESVHPLRIAKQTPNSSPAKMTSGLPRPLSEISPTEKRRNSSSWRQYTPTKKAPAPGNDSSPFQSSPLELASSPRLFWQNRSAENMLQTSGGPSSSPTRRSSIERLQKASRVRNSNILALEHKQEYDPTRLPQIERPLAKVQENSHASPSSTGGLQSLESDEQTLERKSSLSTMSPSKSSPTLSPSAQFAMRPQNREPSSPTKSSLSPSKLHKASFDPESGTWSGHSSLNEHTLPEGRQLNRHPKSVTFDAAPPQINEYEMATPDLSSVGTNSREGSYESADDDYDEENIYDPAHVDVGDDSFDESLEDTDKTPVVGPDDWRGESPMAPPEIGTERFEHSPVPESVPSRAASGRPAHQRTDSATSNGEHRPLPPLPGLGHARSQSASSMPSSPGLSATAERLLGAGSHRSLPVPPPASATKSDIQSFGNGRMTLEERLKLMMLSDDSNAKSAAEQQRERRLRRGAGRDRGETPQSEPESTNGHDGDDRDDAAGDQSILEDYQMPHRISRESIMRKINGNKDPEHETEYHFSSPADTPASRRNSDRLGSKEEATDPDIPIPTIEDPTSHEAYEMDDDDDEGSVIVTRDVTRNDDEAEYEERDEHLQPDAYADDESHYSDDEAEHDDLVNKDLDAGVSTPRPTSSAPQLTLDGPFPDLAPPMFPSPPGSSGEKEAATEVESAVKTAAPADAATEPVDVQRPRTPERQISMPDYDGSGWGEPDDEFDDEPGTPDSVIRHPMPEDDGEPLESPAIPERIATIRSASGSKLKTRISNTPADLASMREARRHVSQEIPAVPPIPERHRNRNSRDISGAGPEEIPEVPEERLERSSSFKNRSLTLDLDMGLSLDQDFERVIESQKRGYLMRQNTKVVTASDNDSSWRARSANNSPVKHERPQSWVIEPWNSETRPRFSRKRPGTSGGIPPLPGQESNSAAFNPSTEDDAQSEVTTTDSAERGRLFVKVMGVKDLDLPLPKSERTWFSLTLDNGVHCVTTAWLELARNAPIGQEFELVVPNDLEFQLTLNVKLEKPVHSSIPTPTVKMNKPKTSTFSRVFASPRKRRELEQRQKAEEERFAQQQREALARRNHSPTGYELLSPLAAEDGSFARAYVCLKEHESRCFGRPYSAEAVLFNEWATEEEGFASSVKSKRGNTTVVRRAPYQIGKLELQLLFVPRPKNAKDEDMPKSMNSCIRELKAAEERLSRCWEGNLSQQGGDCPYWRRRYFKLVGNKLTAYHEATRQPRATINLTNAKRLIDDRRALTERETMGRHGKRRRSAFAEDEEGYMFVEEGFRIRFNNGEVIDFYADTAADKEEWMRVLQDVIGRGESGSDEESGISRSRAKWCELVLKREEQHRRRSENRRSHARTKSSIS
ncbi:hypothetical protein HIM_06489 [Hirsutella minnesotensis 3608]|uniref:PH domain-containing protein n=1 Tax=Hirsutella minnesotensis 3608 TaxID=1043627 RepID=A0A0F7ZNN1_9HYPO|nr:hypothetical protein HIM_06489 [Hirsutella minnesotensis 3608]